MKKWEITRRQTVFDNFFTIEKREYVLPSGETNDYFIYVEKPGACILPITKDNKIVTVVQFRPGPGQVLTEIPGGFIEEHETSRQAAVRELREETGYEGKMKFIGASYNSPWATTVRHTFIATDCEKVNEPHPDKSENITVKLMNVEDFVELARKGHMTNATPVLLALDHLNLL